MLENQISGNFHTSSQYKREKFSQKQNGIILTSNSTEIISKNKILVVNDYFFLKTIGHGSFGEVKLATKDLIEDDYREEHQRFAIKMLKRVTKRKMTFSRPIPNQSESKQNILIDDQLDKTIPEQVLKEINIMKVLVHPNLVQLLEIINSPDSQYIYLVLEYIDGGPIMKYNPTTKKFLSRLTNTTMGESTARKSFIDLLSGLSFMHSHHIAHRDLKPDNLLVDFHGNLKISDFGVSILFEKDTNKSSVHLKDLKSSTSRGMSSHTEGTFPFFSPEMCINESNSIYSTYLADMWAASICLWIFIFGELPFYDSDLSTLFDLIRQCQLKWPHKVSPELYDFLTRCLMKDPKKRIYIMEAQEHCWITSTSINIDNSLERTIPIQDLVSKTSSFNSEIEKKNENIIISKKDIIIINHLTLRQKLHLRQLAQRIRLKCQERHETIVMNLKKEVNSLVSLMLQNITNEGIGVIDENQNNLKNSSFLNQLSNPNSKDHIINEYESINSDPLAALITDVRETSQTSLSMNNSSFHKNEKRNSIDITKFTHLNVLSSLRDDELKRTSKVLPDTTSSSSTKKDIKVKQNFCGTNCVIC